MTITMIHAKLVGIDLLILAALYFCARRVPPLNNTNLSLTAIGLLGFVAHALTFFSGFFLYVQLAMIAAVLLVLRFAPRKAKE